jgi:hypothetical protein
VWFALSAVFSSSSSFLEFTLVFMVSALALTDAVLG